MDKWFSRQIYKAFDLIHCLILSGYTDNCFSSRNQWIDLFIVSWPLLLYKSWESYFIKVIYYLLLQIKQC